VKSHYLALIHSEVPNLNKHLWKLIKSSAQNKVLFMVPLKREDNLIKWTEKVVNSAPFATKMR
jgi:5-formyltetrahydrofolate cyclo-ligase